MLWVAHSAAQEIRNYVHRPWNARLGLGDRRDHLLRPSGVGSPSGRRQLGCRPRTRQSLCVSWSSTGQVEGGTRNGLDGDGIQHRGYRCGCDHVFAVTYPGHGFRFSTVGVILMVVGAIGLVISTIVFACHVVHGGVGMRTTSRPSMRKVVRPRYTKRSSRHGRQVPPSRASASQRPIPRRADAAAVPPIRPIRAPRLHPKCWDYSWRVRPIRSIVGIASRTGGGPADRASRVGRGAAGASGDGARPGDHQAGNNAPSRFLRATRRSAEQVP